MFVSKNFHKGMDTIEVYPLTSAYVFSSHLIVFGFRGAKLSTQVFPSLVLASFELDYRIIVIFKCTITSISRG